MKIALAIFSLAKMGGLERHTIWLAETLAGRGHEVVIYSTAQGAASSAVPIRILPQRGWMNHARMAAFASDIRNATTGQHDVVVACQKLPGPDVLFCADWSVAAKEVPPWKRLLPRYRTMLELERGCFGPASDMFLIMLSEPQAQAYRKAWSIAPGRMTTIPPTLHTRLVRDAPEEDERAEWRCALGVGPDQVAWLWVGLQPKVKGLDRAIAALALSPDAVLLAAGANPQSRAMRAFLKKAEKLGCADRIRLLGMVSGDEIARLYLSADLLIHPSRLDVTATVIVEAFGAGLPVITTENCGYSVHVVAADAGVVLSEAARPVEIAEAAAVSADIRRHWSKNARDYVRTANLTGGIDAAADAIEARGRAAGF
jgi:Glycosyltransferase